jgi:hypothetical protein
MNGNEAGRSQFMVRRGSSGIPDHSALAPEILTTSAHLSISVRM